MYLLLKNSKWHYCFVNSTAIVTARKRSLGQGNMFTGVCLSTGGRVPDQVHPPRDQVHPPGADRPPPRADPLEQVHPYGSRHTPTGADTPQEQTPPRADTPPPQEQTPPRADTQAGADTPPVHRGEYLTRYPWEQTPPPRADTPPGTRYTPQSRHPPGEVHAGRYSQCAGSMHPTGMQSCYHLRTKLREGNAFSHVCLSVCLLSGEKGGGPMWPLPMMHWTLDLTVQLLAPPPSIQGFPWSQSHVQTCSTWTSPSRRTSDMLKLVH